MPDLSISFIFENNFVTNFVSFILSFSMLQVPTVLLHVLIFSFLSYSGWHTLPSHASAEACLTGWPNAQPQGRD